MATGILGGADLAATTDTTVYTVPAGKIAACTVRLCNRTAASITVRLAIAAAGTPTAGEYLEYAASIPANGVLEVTGLVLEALRRVVAWASAAGISANIYGYEEAA